MNCKKCGSYMHSETAPTLSSSLDDGQGCFVNGWSCRICGAWIDANEPPVCPMPPKEHTRHPDGKGGFIRQINHLTGLDRLVWDYRNTIRTMGRTPKEIATKLNELRPGSRLNGNMVAASLNRLENGQIEKKVREEA